MEIYARFIATQRLPTINTKRYTEYGGRDDGNIIETGSGQINL